MTQTKPETTVDIDLNNRELQYVGECLGDVISLAEASQMWRISQPSIRVMWLRGKINGRRTISGGTILLQMSSVIACYGEPKNDPIAQLKREPRGT